MSWLIRSTEHGTCAGFRTAKGLNIRDMKPSSTMKTGTLFSICAIFVALACSKSGTAQEAPTIKVGIVYSFTGTGAQTDKQFDAAVDAWVKQHGDSVAGRKIVLIRRDDGGANLDVAKHLAQELIVQDNVSFWADFCLRATQSQQRKCPRQLRCAS